MNESEKDYPVLVTGGSGYLASRVVKMLLEKPGIRFRPLEETLPDRVKQVLWVKL